MPVKRQQGATLTIVRASRPCVTCGRRAGGRGLAEARTGWHRPRRGGGADATERRGGEAGPGQRQQSANGRDPTRDPTSREGGRRAGGRRTQALGLATELNIRSKRRLEALSRRYPEKLELRAPQGATPIALRMQAQTAARFEDVLAHVTFTGAGTLGQPSGPLMGPDRTRGISHPRSGRAPAGAPPTNRPLLAFRADGGVCGLRMVRPSPTPCAVWF